MTEPIAQTSTSPPGTRTKHAIDSSIRRLVDALNAFDGIQTIGNCGGHPEALKGGQWPSGSTTRMRTHWPTGSTISPKGIHSASRPGEAAHHDAIL